MSRPIWKGYITFGLVNIPVILYSAEKNFDIHFKLLDSRDKARIRYMRINEQTGEEVPWQDIAKGYEYDEIGQMQGTYEELAGALQKRYGYRKEEAEREIETFVDENDWDK